MWLFRTAEQKRQDEAAQARYDIAAKARQDELKAFATKGQRFNYRGIEMLSLGVWGGAFSPECIYAEYVKADGTFAHREFYASDLELLRSENAKEQQ